jgi:hypothetical protein
MLPFFVVVRASLTFIVLARVCAENIFSTVDHACSAVVAAMICAWTSFPALERISQRIC